MGRITTIVTSITFWMLIIAGCGASNESKPANTSWTSVGVAGASRQITVSWAKASTTTTETSTYNLYWSNSPGVTRQTGNKIANVTSPYVHTGLANNTMYYYVVTETISKEESPESPEVATAPKAVVPLTPTGTTVAPLNGAVQIKIDRTGALATTKFNLYWATTPNLVNPTKIANAFGSGLTFQHTALQNNITYYYALTAEGPEGESPLGKTFAATPRADIPAVNYQAGVSLARIAAPTAVTAIAANQVVTLTWNIPASQIPTVFDPAATPTQTPVISAYAVYWSNELISDTSKANKITVPVASKTKPPVSFIHNTGIVNNATYYYLITAVADKDANGTPLKNSSGSTLTFESPISSQVMVTPEAKTPASPTGFTATSGKQQIALSWAKSATANATYRLYCSSTFPARPEDIVTSGNLIVTTNTTTHIHSGLQNGTTYYYAVTAMTEGEGPPSPILAIALR